MRPITIGDYSIGRVAELEFPAFSALEFFPAATPDMVEEARRAYPGRISADGKLVMSFHSFVLRTGRHTILIDTCCNKSRPGRGQFDQGKNDYLAGLADLGVKPEEVTHVMCTHLHWDHVGWNTRRVDGEWVPTFPNAQYVMAKREYDHWDAVYAKEKDNRTHVHALAFEDSVLPLMRAERAVLVADDFELDHGVSIEPCHGHTPGHVVMNVQSNDRRGVLIGDAIHHPMQLLFPDLSTRADSDMDMSRLSRRALIDKHAGTSNLVMPHHFSTPSCGTIEPDGETFRFNFVEGT
jgi:glyoxylase-like metal-dependent hydrolase (beta-lactamase superfamily II)